jgi:hypothetical protein
MKTITFSGFIKIDYSGNWQTIKLVQEDGFKIDLINRFKEAVESFDNYEVQVNYYISDNACTKNEMVEGWLKKLYGSVDASYEANEYRYSSWTSGTDYDTNFTVGGHNLLSELSQEDGKFIIIELNFKDK